jgi:hypothetical protein
MEPVGPLDESVGYGLKQVTTALRTAMDAALRPLDLTVPQYACLEQLGQRPGQSNAELARAVFVTRQSIERRMLAPLSSSDQQRMLRDLTACAAALS